MMRRSKGIATVVMTAWLAVPLAAVAGTERGDTSISRATGRGWILRLSTGTGGGECTASGRRLVCSDGESFSVADADEGCRRVEGGARCTIEVPAERLAGSDESDVDPASAPRPHSTASLENSVVDVECETGTKRGSIYTLDDGDGRGACGPNRDVDGKVNGGTCSKNGSECGSVDCDHGCGASSQNCGCHVKTSTRKAQQSD